MKKQDRLFLVYHLASPVALMVLGLILLFSPDTASALIARVLGWGITLAGIGLGIYTIVQRREVGKGIVSVLCVCVGGFLVANPLFLAAGIGRVLGVLVAARGLRDLFLAYKEGYGIPLPLITTVAGLVLILLPMTTSRLVFRICGAGIVAIGAAMLWDRLKHHPRLPEGDDPNIIDAL